MYLHDVNNNQFKKLLVDFLSFLKEKDYKKDVLLNYRRTLVKIDLFMSENGIREYRPEVGRQYCVQYIAAHTLGKQRISSIKTIIRRLNDYYDGCGYSLTLTKPAELLPVSFELVINDYKKHCHENGNKENTVVSKARMVHMFLHSCLKYGCNDINRLCPEQVEKACLSMENKDTWAVIRVFLKYICSEGIISKDYSTLVPAYSRSFHLPTVYSPKEIKSLEEAINTHTYIGKRDYAMILLASRYGMRSGDIVGLTLGSIDFRTNRICFRHQKTGMVQSLVLIPEVLGALSDYINHVRPETSEEQVFLRMNAPYRPVTTSVLRFALTKYFRLSKVDIEGKKHGPHSLRSSMATSMVNDNVPYEEVRKILGHRDPDAVKHYARTDYEKLRKYAVSVPSPAGSFKKFLEGGIQA